MYLIITESGDAYTTKELTDTHLEEFDAGTVDIFEVSGSKVMRLTESLTYIEVEVQAP